MHIRMQNQSTAVFDVVVAEVVPAVVELALKTKPYGFRRWTAKVDRAPKSIHYRHGRTSITHFRGRTSDTAAATNHTDTSAPLLHKDDRKHDLYPVATGETDRDVRNLT